MNKSYELWFDENSAALWRNWQPPPKLDRFSSGKHWICYCRQVFEETGGAPVIEISRVPATQNSKPKKQRELFEE